MRVLNNAELMYVSGGGEDTATIIELNEEAAINARIGEGGYSGWKDGEVGAAIGSALYSIGKSLGWWN